MKQINEQVSRIRKMMGLNENVNEFFSMPGEREGLPEPVDELFGFSKKEKEGKAQNEKIQKAKFEVSKFKFTTLEAQPGGDSSPEDMKKLVSYRLRDAQMSMPTVAELLPKLFQPQGAQTMVNDRYPDIRSIIPNEWSFCLDNYRINQEKGVSKLDAMLDSVSGVNEDELSGKQKDLAALAEPKNKITGADFAALRHGAKLEEDETNKYAKVEAAIEKFGARGVAVKLVDGALSRMTGMFTASDLPDTATYANGLDTIEDYLTDGDYKSAYAAAKETASDMLEEEGYSDFLSEKDLSPKQKDIAAQAPPYDEITGADFKALRAKKEVNEGSWEVDPSYTHFALTNDDKKIVNGWEYTESDPESIKMYSRQDLIDNDIDPKTVKLYTTRTLKKMGIDPFDSNNWKNNVEVNQMESSNMFSFNDEQDQALNKKFIDDYVNGVERRFRVKKMGVTKDEVMERLDDLGEKITSMDLDYLLYTLAKKGLLFTDSTYTKTVNPQTYRPHQDPESGNKYTDTEKLAFGALDRNMNETIILTKENMFNALSEAKKTGKVNPWAVCTASVGRDDKDKYERCVTDVKKKQGIKK